MEFLKSNLINTTTQIAVNSNTLSISNIFNRNLDYQYYTDGYNSDLLTASITITFDETTAVSRLSLLEFNAKEFRFFYNGLTANAFSLSGAQTTTSSWVSNSETSMFLRCQTALCSSITFEAKKTITANEEKVLGLLFYSDLYLAMPLLPSANNYNVAWRPKQVVHKLSDGGTRIHNIAKKFELDITIDYADAALRNQLLSIYQLGSEFNFCPFGTDTSWDKILFESVWPGDFDFYEYSDNNLDAGFSGTIRLKETPT